MSENKNNGKIKEKTTDKTKDEIFEKLKDIENKIDTVHLDSLVGLQKLESKIDIDKEESSERLNKLEHQLDINKEASKKEAFAISEDQMFFTVIISFLILFITLPVNDMASFLHSVFSIEQGRALANAENIKYVGIGLFLVSSIGRYCAIFGSQNISKILRFFSFETLWIELDLIILVVAINLSTILSPKIGVSGLSVTFLILTLIFIGMLLSERYVLKTYYQKELISKGYFPYASTAFLFCMFALTIALAVELVALTLGQGFSQTRFFWIYIATIGVSVIAFMTRSTRRKKEK